MADAIGQALAGLGVDTVFGVVGSGNFRVTAALCGAGARFHAARHEGGAVAMADGWARVARRPGVCTVHQGPGLTNTLTALAEAAKSRTPLLVLAADTPAAALRSNFRIDQHGLVESVGARAERIADAASAVAAAARALERAERERRPVVLMLPLDVQAEPAVAAAVAPAAPLAPPAPAAAAIASAATLLATAERPVIVAGRGAVLAGARDALEALGARAGALLATSAPAHGLFAGLPFSLGISGGFATPLAVDLLPQADVVLAAGATLNHWTTRHGALIGSGARVIQIDVEAEAIGAHRPADLAVIGDVAAAAEALEAALAARGAARTGWRTRALRDAIAAAGWEDEPSPGGGAGTIHPRALTRALDRLLPADRTVAIDSGHFMGWPAMELTIPDARSWVFSNGFQAVGLGLATAIGAAVARPERLTVAAAGDGGTLMAAGELETAARLGLRNLLVVVYDDAAYGAEVHHFSPGGLPLDNVRFPDADLAALARAAGMDALTVRAEADLAGVRGWLAARERPLLVDAKVDPGVCADWLAEAFRGG